MGLSSWTSSIIVKEKDRREPDRRLIVEKLAKSHAATFTGNTLRPDPDTVASSAFARTSQFTNNEHLLKLLLWSELPSEQVPTCGWTSHIGKFLPRCFNPRHSLPNPSTFTSILSSSQEMGEDENRRRRASL